MVGMQMADCEHGEISELRPALAEAEIGAAADIDHHFRLLADPQEIAGRGPLRVGCRVAGAKDLHRHRIARASLGGRAEGHHDGNEDTNNERPYHGQLLNFNLTAAPDFPSRKVIIKSSP